MKKYIQYIIVLLIACACNNTNKPKQTELLVFCAASLKNVMADLADEYKASNNTQIQLNFASSGTLARQIEHGALPGVYISASEKWVDYLIEKKILEPDSKKKVAGNSLAVIVPKNSLLDSIQFKTNFNKTFKGRLAIGDPKHVPAGEYAWDAILKGGYYDALNNRILPTKDVRSALMIVELGETEMGIVYNTDALRSEKVKIVTLIPEGYHSPIVFFASVLKGKDDEQSRLFYNFLTSKEAKRIWVTNGFNIE